MRRSAAAPEPTATTPDLLAKAKNEGKIVWYTSIELQTAEKIAKAFEAAHPGIDVQVERNGCERIVQRIAQERSSNIRAADVVECSDMTALFAWKKEGWLASYVPADVAKYPADYRDPDGFYATDRLTLSPIEYNTKLVKPEDAPKSFADLLDPKWKGKIVKAHPGYSGTIMTVTYEISRDLGWDYLKKLGTAADNAGAVGRRPAEKGGAGRTPDRGGWRRIPAVADDRERRTARSCLSDGRHADHPGGCRRHRRRAASECRARVRQLPVLEGRTATAGRYGADALGASRRDAAARA